VRVPRSKTRKERRGKEKFRWKRFERADRHKGVEGTKRGKKQFTRELAMLTLEGKDRGVVAPKGKGKHMSAKRGRLLEIC